MIGRTGFQPVWFPPGGANENRQAGSLSYLWPASQCITKSDREVLRGKHGPAAECPGGSRIGSRAPRCGRGGGQRPGILGFFTYPFFAVYIGRAFFPSNSPTASLLASLGTFGVGFVTRPVGSFFIGRMGDRAGRKPAMLLAFFLMGIAIAGLALTPSHQRIGFAAPVLVIFFRMLQGFALGGEV